MRLVLIKASGEIEVMNPESEPGLEQMQGWVGGWLEAVNLRDDALMWVNEEGGLYHLPPNPMATVLATRFAPDIRMHGGYIHGDVVLSGRDDPAMAGVPEWLDDVIERLREIRDEVKEHGI